MKLIHVMASVVNETVGKGFTVTIIGAEVEEHPLPSVYVTE
jgi:hypothetical protein